jgi:hypothetical protein
LTQSALCGNEKAGMLGLKRGAFGSAPIFKVDAEEESKVGEKENQKRVPTNKKVKAASET